MRSVGVRVSRCCPASGQAGSTPLLSVIWFLKLERVADVLQRRREGEGGWREGGIERGKEGGREGKVYILSLYHNYH